MGYLKGKGCFEFDFLDLRLGVPDSHSPTWTYTGVFAEAYVLDIPDLPLVLQLLRAVDKGSSMALEQTPPFERYCLERGILPRYLRSYVSCLDRYFEVTVSSEEVGRGKPFFADSRVSVASRHRGNVQHSGVLGSESCRGRGIARYRSQLPGEGQGQV